MLSAYEELTEALGGYEETGRFDDVEWILQRIVRCYLGMEQIVKEESNIESIFSRGEVFIGL